MNELIRRPMKLGLGVVAGIALLAACGAEPGDGQTAGGGSGSDEAAPSAAESPLDTDLNRVGVALVTQKLSLAATEAVSVTVTMTNGAAHPVRLLRWNTAVDGIREPLFDVWRDGVAVDYVGRHYKRPAPRPQDYVVLAAGESVTHTVDLAEAYDVSLTGDYTVRFHAEVPSAVRPLELVDAVLSNDVRMKVEGRPSLLAPPAEDRGTQNIGATSYSGSCTSSEKTQLATALSSAAAYASNAVTYLNGTPGSKPRYTTWFGAYSSTNWSTARSHFTAIKNAIDTKNFVLDCSCTDDYYAYVYPTQPYKVYLCNAFWSAPNTGTDSRAGTLIHETSHFNAVASTDDRAYGKTACQKLARTPSKALDNADSHEYFAENTPALN